MARQVHPDPLLREIDTPLRSVLYPLGFAVEIATNDQRVLECAQASFGIFPSVAGAPVSLRMRLLGVPGGSSGPPWPNPAYRSWRHLFTVVCGPDNFLSADLAGREAMGCFSPAMLDDAEFFRWTFLDCVTYVAIQRHYMTPIHAACVVRDGHGICLSAPAGTGKSSLAYRCAEAGYKLLGDDGVWLLRSGPRLQLRGNPSRLHFPVSARDLLPGLRKVPVGIRRDGHEFLAVPAADFFPSQLVIEAEPGPVVFLERRPDAAPAIERIPADEAHRLLFEPIPLLDDEETMAEHARVIRRLVEDGAYRLRYSLLDQALRQLDGIPLLQRTRP